MIPTRLGRAAALKSLLSPFGLARRLQRNTLRGWTAAIIVLSASYGFIIKEFENFLGENEELREAFAQIGDASFRDIMISVLISFMAITITGYAIQSLLRLRSEESNGQLESILGTGVSRWKWQLSHISYSAIGVILLTFLSGLSMGSTYIISIGGSLDQLWPILGASMVGATATFALMGFVIAVIALWPRLAVAISWASFAGCLLLLQLGELLKLPQWVMDLSPFGHLPAMPAQDFKLTPVVWLSAAAVGLTLGGLAYFNRRDITTT